MFRSSSLWLHSSQPLLFRPKHPSPSPPIPEVGPNDEDRQQEQQQQVSILSSLLRWNKRMVLYLGHDHQGHILAVGPFDESKCRLPNEYPWTLKLSTMLWCRSLRQRLLLIAEVDYQESTPGWYRRRMRRRHTVDWGNHHCRPSYHRLHRLMLRLLHPRENSPWYEWYRVFNTKPSTLSFATMSKVKEQSCVQLNEYILDTSFTVNCKYILLCITIVTASDAKTCKKPQRAVNKNSSH